MTYSRMFAVRLEKERYQELRALSGEMDISMSDAIRGVVALITTRPEWRALLNVEKSVSDESGQ